LGRIVYNPQEFVVEASSSLNHKIVTPAKTDDSLLPFDLPGVQRKKVSAAVDGGLISSDGGLVLLRPGKTPSGPEVHALLKHPGSRVGA